MAEHISSQFNGELESVRTLVMQMGGLLEKQFNTTLNALSNLDLDALHQVIIADEEVNSMEIQIDDECQLIIARRQPAASDLRLVLAVSRVIVDLERIGDEIKKAAQTAHRLIEAKKIEKSDFFTFNRIFYRTAGMLRLGLDAFARIDTSALLTLIEEDEKVDLEYKAQTRTLITYMMEDPKKISTSIDLMFMNKAVERIGDHTVNIGEHVVYLANGIDVRHHTVDSVKQILNQP